MQIVPRVQLPVTTLKRRAWNKGRIIGQKRPLVPKQVWAIRTWLELAGCRRDLAWFNVAFDSNLRAVQLLLGHMNIDTNVRYLGVELEGALSNSERIDI